MPTDLAFEYLKKKIRAIGINCAGYKDDFLKRRLEGRMRMLGLTSYADYAYYIEKHPSEFTDLYDALTINVSEFFRDITVWDALRRDILPGLVREKLVSGKKQLKVWSAGIADGEEPYTHAILILETLAYLSRSFKIEVLGTDIDPLSLSRAQRGIYSPLRLKIVSKPILQRYFLSNKDGTFAVTQAVKDLVTFRSHDLFTAPVSNDFDIISCRNVIIYFSRELQERLLRNFYNALLPNGYLILGKVETLVGEATPLFDNVNLAERIYKKASAAVAVPIGVH
ncbi:MAG TPA: protein-glutamate O-methyltransferase CheR [Terriglobales bacterium]|nr:protein-glutamate O-methyltransferase CheR [Terriglobales bacterium]